MDLELATMEDIINELRQRKVRFVFVGIEPSNQQAETAQISAAAKDTTDILRLLRLGRSALEKTRYRERGDSDEGPSQT
jgi:hypothetical protein